MKKLLSTLIIIGVALGMADAQEPVAPTVRDSLCHHFTADIRGNLYVWQGSDLKKYDAAGQLLSLYGNPALGTLNHVNASNPLKIFLFYAESGTIIFLDDKLSPVGNRLNLFEHNLNTVSLATFASPNRIILFDESNQDLIITDMALNIIGKTHCTFDNFAPSQIQIVKEKTILLNNPPNGVYFFDIFGSYDRRLSIPNIQDLQLVGNSLYYTTDGKLQRYNILKMEKTEIPLPCSSPTRQFCITPNIVWTLNRDGIYKIPIERTFSQ